MIEGVIINPLKHISVPKGDVFHALKCTDKNYYGFGEAYFTHIEANKVKGWKRHNRMAMNLFVVYGRVKFVIYDDREGSNTKGKFEEIIISPDDDVNYKRLTISPGLWMAFIGANEKTSIIMDIIPEPHDPNESDRKDLNEISYNFII